MLFVVKGELGAVQFVLYTNWQLPHVVKEWEEKYGRDNMPSVFCRPIPADVGYHSPKPMYEDQRPIGSTKVDHEAMMRNLDRMRQKKEGEGDFTWEETAHDTGTFTPCEWLGGKPCYYDGSGLAAEEYFKTLVAEGSEALWEKLEGYYKETFENGRNIPSTEEYPAAD